MGKILQDYAQIKDYLIKDNAKLMLTRIAKPDLRKLIFQHFSRYYNNETSSLFTNLFMENLKVKFVDYSLDDLERLAEEILIV